MTYYTTFDPKDMVIWGMGETEEAARKDTVRWISEWSASKTEKKNLRSRLSTLRCSQAVYTRVLEDGGSGFRFKVRGNWLVMDNSDDPCPVCSKQILNHDLHGTQICLRAIREGNA